MGGNPTHVPACQVQNRYSTAVAARNLLILKVQFGGEGGIRAESRRACEPRGSLKSTRDAIECEPKVSEMAERVGFELPPVIENKELNGFLLPHDPPDPHESRDRDTY